MTTEAEIRIVARDEASKAIQNVRGELDKATTATTKTHDASTKLAGSLGSVAKIAGGFVLAQGLMKLPGILTGFVSAASNMNESLTKIDAVFGDNAQSIKDWAKTASTAMGQSQQQALEAAGTYGNLFQAFGVGRDEATDMSKQLVQLASDLASFNNTSVDDALMALRAGLSGETEPLKRFGVALSVDRMEAEAAAKGFLKLSVNQADVQDASLKLKEAQAKLADALKKGGKASTDYQKAQIAVTKAEEALAKAQKGSSGQMDPATKALAAYSLIMHDTALAQGDFARTSDGLANKMRILQAKWRDFQVQIGQAFLPVALSVVTVLVDQLFPALDGIGNLISTKLGPAMAAFGAAVGPIVQWVAELAKKIGENKTVMDALGVILSGVLVGALIAAGAAVAGLVAGWLAFMGPAAAVLGAVAGIGVALQALGINFGDIVSKVQELAHLFKLGFEGGKIGGEFSAIEKAAFTMGTVFRENIIPAFKDAGEAIRLFFFALQGGQAGGNFSTLQQSALDFGKAVRETWLNDIKPTLETFMALMGTVAGFVADHWNEIKAVIVFAIDDAVTRIKGFFKVLGGIIDIVAGVVKTVDSLIHGDWSGAWEGFKQAVTGAVEVAKGTISLMLGDLPKLFLGLVTELYDAGWNAIQGFINGMVNKAKEIPGIIKDKVVDLIPGGVQKLLGIASPSRVMMRIGEYVSEGLAQGIRTKAGQLLPSLMKEIGDTVKLGIEGIISNISSAGGDVLTQLRYWNAQADAVRLANKATIAALAKKGGYVMFEDASVAIPGTVAYDANHGNMQGYYGGAAKSAETSGRAVSEGFSSGISSGTKSVEMATKVMTDAVTDGTKRYMAISSPSKVMEVYGHQIGEGLSVGMIAAAGADVNGAADFMVEIVNGKWVRATEKAAGSGHRLASSLAAGISQGAGEAGSAGEALASAAISGFNKTMSKNGMRQAEDGSWVPANYWDEKTYQPVRVETFGKGDDYRLVPVGPRKAIPTGGATNPGVIKPSIINPPILGKYASGTDYVPSDGLAYLHKGEAVIPAHRNRGGMGINVTLQNNGVIIGLMDAERWVREQFRSMVLSGGLRGLDLSNA